MNAQLKPLPRIAAGLAPRPTEDEIAEARLELEADDGNIIDAWASLDAEAWRELDALFCAAFRSGDTLEKLLFFDRVAERVRAGMSPQVIDRAAARLIAQMDDAREAD